MAAPKYGWMRTAGTVASIPLLILVSAGIGGYFGWWLDGKLGTKPWLTGIMIVIGLVAGLYESGKLLIEITRENQD
ncbi:MAG: AtpZ/AtpI family protein [Armatimonadetes bacterium]|nr:AtpZ/AtpI family protein [Armatimonadota bacterium]